MSRHKHTTWDRFEVALAILVVLTSASLVSRGQDKTLDLPVERAAPVTSAPPIQVKTPDPEIPPTIYGDEIKSENQAIVFVIDISGSMAYDPRPYTTADGEATRGNRLDRAKAELVRCIGTLPLPLRFDVLAYDCAISAWAGELREASTPNRRSAREWVMGLIPGGGTGTGPATVQALQEKARLVVLLTDGSPNCGSDWPYGGPATDQQHRAMIQSANTQHASIDVFGIAAVGVCEQFCRDVATENGGSYHAVP